MDPELTTLKMQTQVLKDLASRRQDNDGMCVSITAWVSTWCEIGGLATTLIQANRKMQGTDDLQKFWKDDAQGALLKVITNTRAKLNKLGQKCQQLLQKVALPADDSDSVLSRTFNTELPPALVTEMQNAAFDDAVSWQAAAITQQLEAAENKYHRDVLVTAKKYESDVGEGPEEVSRYLEKYEDGAWCVDMCTADVTIDALQERAAETIFVRLPAAAMTAFCGAAKDAAGQH